MSQAQLDLFDPTCFADLFALDSIAIVAATMPYGTTRLIYPITRLILSDAILLENQVPLFVLNYALDSIISACTVSGKPSPPSLEKILEWYRKHASPFPNFVCEHPPDLSLRMREPLLGYIYDYLTQPIDTSVLHTAAMDSLGLDLDNPALPSASHGVSAHGEQHSKRSTGKNSLGFLSPSLWPSSFLSWLFFRRSTL
ncbi:hypothetical protein GOP47_0018969 [Adiantum capillus-veneris]|uniref:Uncharacterized protein n=1 Tax=Adiantum capillus-veneris TaxID=13818 RepID=A0A9D4UEI7_ADICA|nr:hypothetical protein GOP47_0018969 [Adiantum capillus-veneris]